MRLQPDSCKNYGRAEFGGCRDPCFVVGSLIWVKKRSQVMILRLFVIFALFAGISATHVPTRSLASSLTPKEVFSVLLKLMGIDDIDVSMCWDDSHATATAFHDFNVDITNKQYSQGLTDLSTALNSLETSIKDCGVSDQPRRHAAQPP